MSPCQKHRFFWIQTARSPRFHPCCLVGLPSTWGAASTKASTIPASPHADERGLRKDVMEALRDQGYTRDPLSGRQLPERLQLAGWRRPQGTAPAPPRAGLAVDRNQPVWHQRIHGVLPAKSTPRPCWASTWAPATSRPPPTWSSTATRPPGTYWSDLRASHGYPRAPQRTLLVRRQRDGRSLADRSPGCATPTATRPSKPPR